MLCTCAVVIEIICVATLYIYLIGWFKIQNLTTAIFLNTYLYDRSDYQFLYSNCTHVIVFFIEKIGVRILEILFKVLFSLLLWSSQPFSKVINTKGQSCDTKLVL